MDECLASGPAETQRVFGERRALLAPFMPFLGALGPTGPPPLPAAAPELESRRRASAVLDVLDAYVEPGEHALLVLDDVQWADHSSAEVIESLVRHRLPERAWTVLMLFRSDQAGAIVDQWIADELGQVLTLEGLPPDDVRALIGEVLGEPDPSSDLAAWVTHHSGGNPFYVIEYMRLALGRGLLERAPRGGWTTRELGQISASHRALPVPRSVQALLGERLGALSEDALYVAQLAALLGRTVKRAELTAVAGLSEGALHDALAQLERRDILEHRAATQTLRFAHDQLRKACTDAMSSERSRPAHQRIAEHLVEHAPDDLERIAEHWTQGGEVEQAWRAWRAAGNALREEYALRDALACYIRALALMPEDHPERPVLERTAAHDCLRQLGRDDEARAMLSNAMTASIARGDTRGEGESLIAIGSLNHERGALEEAQHANQRALEIFEELGDQHSQMRLLNNMALNQRSLGNADRAAELWKRGLSMARELDDERGVRRITFNLGTLREDIGALEDALELFTAAQHTDPSRDEDHELSMAAMRNAALLHQRMGRPARAESMLVRVLEDAESAGHKSLITEITMRLASLKLDMGEMREAWRLTERALELCDTISIPQLREATLRIMGALCRVEGDVDKALMHARLSMTVTEVEASRLITLDSAVDCAPILLEAGEIDEVLRTMDEARAYFKQRGMRPHVSVALRLLGCAQAKRGDADGGMRLLEDAINEAHGTRREYAHANLEMGLLMLDLGRADWAEPYIEEVTHCTAPTVFSELYGLGLAATARMLRMQRKPADDYIAAGFEHARQLGAGPGSRLFRELGKA